MAHPPPNHLASLNLRALTLIHTLHLTYLPYESGYIGLLGTSAQLITNPTGRRLAAQSQNYYMLTANLNINYLHHLDSDDTHILIEGGPVVYYIFHSDGRTERVVLGRDVENGERMMVSVPGGAWKALVLGEGVGYALMGNVLSPEFTGDDRVQIGFREEEEREEWIERFVGGAEWVTDEFLRELIGGDQEEGVK